MCPESQSETDETQITGFNRVHIFPTRPATPLTSHPGGAH
jgi:hypothetical protein